MVVQTRSMMWAGVLFGAGMLAAMVGVVGVPGARGRAGRPRRSFPALGRAIVGTNKGIIVDVFGPPPTATHTHSGDYRASETWYYPLDVREQSAMAITFGGRAGDEAVAVEKFYAPR